MFCCPPLCCKPAICNPSIYKIDTSTSPMSSDYARLEDSFSEIIEHLDNNSYEASTCNNCKNGNNQTNIMDKENELTELFKQHNKVEIENANLENKLVEQNQYILHLESTLKKEITNVIKDKKCYLNSGCRHDMCDITYYKNKVIELEKQINFYKLDYNTIIQNNVNYKKNIEEANKIVYFKTTIITECENKINNLCADLENTNKINNKLKELNHILNEKNRSLIKENISNLSDNEYLNQSNKRLKERLSNKLI